MSFLENCFTNTQLTLGGIFCILQVCRSVLIFVVEISGVRGR